MLEDPEFKRYVLNEFFWELMQHSPLPPEFVAVDRESIEVLHFKPNRDLCIRLGNYSGELISTGFSPWI